jgi:hypothetical protein
VPGTGQRNPAAQAAADVTPEAEAVQVLSTTTPHLNTDDFHGIVFGLGPLESFLEPFSEGIEAAFERGLADARKRDGALPDHVHSIR